LSFKDIAFMYILYHSLDKAITIKWMTYWIDYLT
jgi:hypothetical protein